MNYFIDIGWDNLNKYGEELCGDNVEVAKTDNGMIIVLADGLGSGVKANILATLTSKIAITMLKEGLSLDDTVDTILRTLPVCQVRQLAYSTFTIVKIYNDGRVYAAEYDNPPLILMRGEQHCKIDKKDCILNGRRIKESNFTLMPGDTLTIISDGAVHAGVGAILNLGWQWENIAEYLGRFAWKEKCAKNISKELINVCQKLYLDRPGDDVTVVTVKVREPEIVNLFTGPPEDPDDDAWVVKRLMKGKGKKIVCGGTAGNIVARELGEELITNIDFIDPDVPPTAQIKGIDLVTEGVLTLSKAVEKIRRYAQNSEDTKVLKSLHNEDGASMLARMLIEDCTHLNLLVGKAVNPAHQNPDLPFDLSIKQKVVKELAEWLKKLGKEVALTYV